VRAFFRGRIDGLAETDFARPFDFTRFFMVLQQFIDTHSYIGIIARQCAFGYQERSGLGYEEIS
jgi:hypothetical protein